MDSRIESKVALLEQYCRKRRVPLTVQRRAIMTNLAGRLDHPTADEVYEQVRAYLPDVSRATVYRSLEAFVALGMAVKISSPEAKARFDADSTRHHHIHCVRCGRVSDFTLDDRLPGLTDICCQGFRVIDYSISASGVCCRCDSKKDRDCD